MYIAPDIVPLTSDVIVAEADEAQLDKSGSALMNGHVELQRDTYLLHGDSVNWNQQTGEGQFVGNVSVYTPWSTLHSKEALFSDQGTGNAANLNLTDAQYALPDYHMRGEAQSINTRSNGQIHLERASMTFCEPGHNDWDILASRIDLDQKRGIGSAWHTRLRVLDVPVLYIPYYRFPIDDRRTTGFLDPSFALNGSGQLEDFQAPFYINIAPNMDATITPHHILDRGFLWEGQFRHKTALMGDGEFNYGYLNQDGIDNRERWLINYSQSGEWSKEWTHNWEYNHVSDDDYLSDLNSTNGVNRTTHLPRRGEIHYLSQHWQADLVAEGFQTIDNSLSLNERPYQRLPQINLTYQQVKRGWQLGQTVQLSRFRRDQEATIDGASETLTGFDGLYGQRLVADSHISWEKRWSYAYLKPSVDLRYRQYQLSHDQRSTLDSDYKMTAGHALPRYHLDAGMTFERTLENYTTLTRQTLEPRLFWAKSPYLANQTDIPAFDSGDITFDYDSLFTGDRFTGYDRLADLDQISLGVTTRLFSAHGKEYVSASLGQIYYQQDRRVVLDAGDEVDNLTTSTTLTEINWYPTQQWRVGHTLEWDFHDQFARQHRFDLRYRDDADHIANLGLQQTRNINAETRQPDTLLHQANASFFWALSDRWAVTGKVLQDLNHYNSDEQRPESSTLEALAGFEYQNCCWKLQVLYQETSPTDSDSTSLYSTSQKRSVLFSIQLKGLTTLGGSTNAILSQSINGYSRRHHHDY